MRESPDREARGVAAKRLAPGYVARAGWTRASARTAEAPRLNEILIELAIILALVLANGVFAGAEIAIISLRKTRLAQLVEEGRASARAVKRLRDEPERFLATVQVGITVVGATAAAFGGAAARRPARPVPRARSRSLGALRGRRSRSPSSSRIVSFLSLVLGELVPKSLALRASERYALLVARPLLGLSERRPPDRLAPHRGLEPRAAPLRRPDDLQRGAPVGGGDRAARRRGGQGGRARRADRGDRLARARVPRPHRGRRDGAAQPRRGAAARRAARGAEAAAPRGGALAHAGLRRARSTTIVGYVDGEGPRRDGVGAAAHRARRPRPARSCSSRRPRSAVHVLREMQRRRTQIAVVVDEHGGVAGLLTLEDLVEELVGDILGEQEQPEALFQPRAGRHRARARRRADPRGEPRARRSTCRRARATRRSPASASRSPASVPERGARLRAPDGTEMEVVDASPRVVRLVRLRPRAAEPPPAAVE